MSRGGVMSDKLKTQLAHELGFGEKVEDGDWGDVTTREVGMMVREAIKRAEQTLVSEATETLAESDNDAGNTGFISNNRQNGNHRK